MLRQGRLDLIELNAAPLHSDLPIAPAKKQEIVIRIVAHEIARAIKSDATRIAMHGAFGRLVPAPIAGHQ